MAGLPPEAAGPLNAVLKPMVDRAYGPAVARPQTPSSAPTRPKVPRVRLGALSKIGDLLPKGKKQPTILEARV